MISIVIDKSKQLPGINNAFISLDSYQEDVIEYLRRLSARSPQWAPRLWAPRWATAFWSG